mmetsp:Transcript_56862/g.135343  ORF Transcript_56862/g.135343 Transcript_56862/m.135343 type:complete len:280 (-) Transcript_56862:207-1046(-)
MGLRSSREAGISLEEVEKHTSKDDAWLILFGEAIDVTQFIPVHPGGEELMMMYLGKDATKDWQQIHQPDSLEKHAALLRKVGKVQVNSSLMSWLFKKLSAPGGSYAKPERPTVAEEIMREEAEAAAKAAAAQAEPAAEEVEPVKWSAEHEGELPPGGVFDMQELSRWDGIQLPMCIGICGLVLDVSGSENFVPNFGYGKLWAGRDTTYAMAMVSLKSHDANRLDWKLEELSPDHRKALAGWYKHFTTKYRQVGTLRELRDWDFSTVAEEAKGLPAMSMS